MKSLRLITPTYTWTHLIKVPLLVPELFRSLSFPSPLDSSWAFPPKPPCSSTAFFHVIHQLPCIISFRFPRVIVRAPNLASCLLAPPRTGTRSHCASLHCASQVVWFLQTSLEGRQDPPLPAKVLRLALLRLALDHGGLDLKPQSLRGMTYLGGRYKQELELEQKRGRWA